MWDCFRSDNYNDQEGFSLIEMIVAVGVVVVVMLAVASGVSTSLKNSRYSQEKALSVRYAQEALEEIRLLRDKLTWENFTDLLERAGVADDGTKWQACFKGENRLEELLVGGSGEISQECGDEDLISGTNYSREIEVYYDGSTVRTVSRVYWDDGTGSKITELENSLRDWR